MNLVTQSVSRVTSSYVGKEDKKSVVQKVFHNLMEVWDILTFVCFDQVWGLLYTNTMVRVELGSGLDQRSLQAILAYIGSGHRTDVQTPTSCLRCFSFSCSRDGSLPHMICAHFNRVSVQPSEMRSVEDLVLHSPLLVTVVVSR